MTRPLRNALALLAPVVACGGGFLLWKRFGFDRLDSIELPVAMAMNGIVGRVAAIDYLLIYFNRWPGEALCVVIMMAIYAAIAWRLTNAESDRAKTERTPLHLVPPARHVAGFAVLIFATWYVVNNINNRLERVFERQSPAIILGDEHRNLDAKYTVKVKTVSGRSFPSNHGSVFFIVFFMTLFRWGAGRWIWLMLPAVIVLSTPRVFGGAHWMTDTLIGSVLVTWLVAAFVMFTPVYARLYLPLEARLSRLIDTKLENAQRRSLESSSDS
ncbi:MAG TPA: phosphatase PAP2 family protein [Phycisphaerales bacterium]|nr:phosphatase PAP2 family protein [Phycisphaerales bacterium]HRQ75043.1 phosphatase PAP2 family protein [Phycisphaerales bacterium]